MSLGVPELVLILVIVIIVFGVGRLGGIGNALGGAIRDFRAATQDRPAAAPPPAAILPPAVPPAAAPPAPQPSDEQRPL